MIHGLSNTLNYSNPIDLRTSIFYELSQKINNLNYISCELSPEKKITIINSAMNRLSESELIIIRTQTKTPAYNKILEKISSLEFYAITGLDPLEHQFETFNIELEKVKNRDFSWNRDVEIIDDNKLLFLNLKYIYSSALSYIKGHCMNCDNKKNILRQIKKEKNDLIDTFVYIKIFYQSAYTSSTYPKIFHAEPF